MNCLDLNIEHQDLEYRKFVFQSIDCALKKGDEVLQKFKERDSENIKVVSFVKFKASLKNIDHENLKK